MTNTGLMAALYNYQNHSHAARKRNLLAALVQHFLKPNNLTVTKYVLIAVHELSPVFPLEPEGHKHLYTVLSAGSCIHAEFVTASQSVPPLVQVSPTAGSQNHLKAISVTCS